MNYGVTVAQANADLTVTTREEAHITVVRCVGRIDAATHTIFEMTLKKLYTLGQYNLILDLSRVTFISSPGARAIIAALAKSEDNKGQIVFLNPNPNVSALFNLIGLSELIAVSHDMSEAIAQF